MSDGSEKLLKDLQYGDMVSTVNVASPASLEKVTLSPSPILTFSHRDAMAQQDKFTTVIEIHVQAIHHETLHTFSHGLNKSYHDSFPCDFESMKRRTLQITPNHLMPVILDYGKSVKVIAAREVEKGATVALANFHSINANQTDMCPQTTAEQGLQMATVIDVRRITSYSGFYAPMTINNNIIVDGIVVSCATENMLLSHRRTQDMHGSLALVWATHDWILYVMLAPVYVLNCLYRLIKIVPNLWMIIDSVSFL